MKSSILYIFLTLMLSSITPIKAQKDKKNKSNGRIIRIIEEEYAKETAEGLVIVDFYAHWCGSCMTMNPILQRMAKEHSEDIKIIKVNTDLSQKLTTQMEVTRLPTIFIYKDGEIKNGYLVHYLRKSSKKYSNLIYRLLFNDQNANKELQLLISLSRVYMLTNFPGYHGLILLDFYPPQPQC